MFHAISGRLAHQARRIRDHNLADDLGFAADHGWTAREITPGTWAYRDPRFTTRSGIRAGHTLKAGSPSWARQAMSHRIAALPATTGTEGGAGHG